MHTPATDSKPVPSAAECLLDTAKAEARDYYLHNESRSAYITLKDGSALAVGAGYKPGQFVQVGGVIRCIDASYIFMLLPEGAKQRTPGQYLEEDEARQLLENAIAKRPEEALL